VAKSTSSHVPVFDESVRDFFQESRRPLENVAVAGVQAHVRIAQVKLVARARDRDVKQTSFFLERFARVERTRTWKHPVGQPNDEDSMKFQTFGLMHGR